jgi:zinc D-Ala-D-Ala dipeptidase
MQGKIATFLELQAIPYRDNKESLILLDSTVLSEYRRENSGVQSVLVRESVSRKLQNIQKQLRPNMKLIVVEGYRSLTYQEAYFLKELRNQLEEKPSWTLEAILEQTHQFVALPSVAGHPTGGAIDLTIICDGKEVDMGGKIADFSVPELLPTYSQQITIEQSNWRIFLHDLMVAEGFAPFYGEWWHFSYGDREWAAFYEQPAAIYSPIFN